jgi:hypothetical protein
MEMTILTLPKFQAFNLRQGGRRKGLLTGDLLALPQWSAMEDCETW